MKTKLADYILKLKEGQDKTHRAEDRSVYTSLLADASVIFALVEKGTNKQEIQTAINNHERLRGHTWLDDPAHEPSSKIWGKINKI
jgi:hypothetical protein